MFKVITTARVGSFKTYAKAFAFAKRHSYGNAAILQNGELLAWVTFND